MRISGYKPAPVQFGVLTAHDIYTVPAQHSTRFSDAIPDDERRGPNIRGQRHGDKIKGFTPLLPHISFTIQPTEQDEFTRYKKVLDTDGRFTVIADSRERSFIMVRGPKKMGSTQTRDAYIKTLQQYEQAFQLILASELPPLAKQVALTALTLNGAENGLFPRRPL